jgi:hypothetical protein
MPRSFWMTRAGRVFFIPAQRVGSKGTTWISPRRGRTILGSSAILVVEIKPLNGQSAISVGSALCSFLEPTLQLGAGGAPT